MNSLDATRRPWSDGRRLAMAGAPETAIRLRSSQLLDRICRELTRQHQGMDVVRRHPAPLELFATATSARTLLRFSRALAFTDGSPEGERSALRLLSQLAASEAAEQMTTQSWDLLAQLRLIHEPLELVNELDGLRCSTGIRTEIAADLLHPIRSPAFDHSTWLRAFRRVIGREWAAPRDAWKGMNSQPFDRLTATSTPDVIAAGPLVSCIVTSFNPDQKLLTALRSLASQSWQELEIILVDDGSAPSYDAVLRAAEAIDPRIRLVRNRDNLGTYARRNQGLDLARGELLTFHDDDDVSAPARIAEHARVMEAEPWLAATLSRCRKLETNLQITRLGYSSLDANAQSLMIRRRAVLPRIGYFQAVRRGGDGEYIRRIQAAMGSDAIREVGSDALMLYRRTPGSLSSSDFSPGRRSRRRWLYQSITAYALEHRRSIGDERWYLPRHDTIVHSSSRVSDCTAAPQPARTYDCGFIADLRRRNPNFDGMWGAVVDAVGRGLRVAIAQCDRFDALSSRDEPLAPEALAAVLEGRVTYLAEGVAHTVGHVLVEDAVSVAHGLLPEGDWTARSATLLDAGLRGPAGGRLLQEAARLLRERGVLTVATQPIISRRLVTSTLADVSPPTR